jgi:hypothetical protein
MRRFFKNRGDDKLEREMSKAEGELKDALEHAQKCAEEFYDKYGEK